MTATRCSACGRTVDIEPVKCPYCTVVQPNRAYDPRIHWLFVALLSCVGLFVGFSAGEIVEMNAPPRAPVESVGRSRIDVQHAAVRASLAAAIEAAVRAGDRAALGEDLLFGPATYANQRIAVSGFLEFVEVKADKARFRISERWGGQPFIGVDGAALSIATRKELLRKSWPPQVIVARGVWRQGAFEGLGSELGYYLAADDVAFAGELAGGQMKDVR